MIRVTIRIFQLTKQVTKNKHGAEIHSYTYTIRILTDKTSSEKQPMC